KSHRQGSIAPDHDLSQPCDHVFGTSARIHTFLDGRGLNLPARRPDNGLRGERAAEAAMNHSFYSADRTTHLKIVIVALVAATAVAGIGVTARVSTNDTFAQADRAQIIKAGKPVMVTTSGQTQVR